jgi:hypothetical protein
MKIRRIAFILLVAALYLTEGCALFIHHRDPLAGWNVSSLDALASNRAITADYHSYIQKLPVNEKKLIGSIHFLEGDGGRHAVKIEIDMHGTWREHVLFYDQINRRESVLKYVGGHYKS